MQITPDHLGVIAGAVSLLVTTGVAISQVRLARRNQDTQDGVAKVQGATAVIEGYEALCKSLTEQIAQLYLRIAENERDIATLRKELVSSRQANRELQERVVCLEEENSRLHEEIQKLQQQRERVVKEGR